MNTSKKAPAEMDPTKAWEEILIPSNTRKVQPNRKYKTPGEFNRAVDRYIELCIRGGVPITKTGLILYLGFSARHVMQQYKDGFMGDEMIAPVERAELLVEFAYERRLHEGSPSGAIFALKQMGWRESSDVNHLSTDGSMSPKPPSTINIVGVNPDEDED